MAKSTKRGKQPNKVVALPKMPTKFNDFSGCVSRIKKSTYMIVRGIPIEQEGKNGFKRETLGTGVIVSHGRLITCAHVIHGGGGHREDTPYYLVRHDDLDNRHTSVFSLKIDESLFIYEEYDLAIIYLQKEFYKSGDRIFKTDNEYVKINKQPQFIGTEIGILGYPHCKLNFHKGDLQKPLIGDIIVRADRGVINSRYRAGQDNLIYNEFTIQFNKGNSGGPIFSTKDGTLIGLVKGFKKIPSDIKPIEIEESANDGGKKKTQQFDVHFAYYSIGIPVENYLDILKEHNIV